MGSGINYELKLDRSRLPQINTWRPDISSTDPEGPVDQLAWERGILGRNLTERDVVKLKKVADGVKTNATALNKEYRKTTWESEEIDRKGNDYMNAIQMAMKKLEVMDAEKLQLEKVQTDMHKKISDAQSNFGTQLNDPQHQMYLSGS